MKSIAHQTTLCFLLSFPTLLCLGQTAENIKATFKDGKAIITYELIGVPGRVLYKVDLYASYNNFSEPLKLVIGDVGMNVRAGKWKKIEWEAAKEMGKADDSITFQIKSDWISTPSDKPITFLNPNGGLCAGVMPLLLNGRAA